MGFEEVVSLEKHVHTKGHTEPRRFCHVQGSLLSTRSILSVVGARPNFMMLAPLAHVSRHGPTLSITSSIPVSTSIRRCLQTFSEISRRDAVQNLRAEGEPEEEIHFVGNVMIDSLVRVLPAARALDVSGVMGVGTGPYVVATLHRPSNVDNCGYPG